MAKQKTTEVEKKGSIADAFKILENLVLMLNHWMMEVFLP